MKKQTLQLLTLIFLHTALYAQTGEEASPQNFQRYSFLQKNMVAPTSPEAASLGKYGDFNVNKYTGTANIGIPLYTLAGKTIQVPISLNYNASGLKVDESATWVGMGWALGAGGVITRSMQGLPDQEDNYFEKAEQLNQSQTFTDLFEENTFLQDVARGAIESQPDNFYFNFPGSSGKFYISPNRTVVQKDFSGLKIEPFFSAGEIIRFVITDLNGTRYTFESIEETTYQMADVAEFSSTLFPVSFNYRFYSSWFLTEVVSITASERIKFSYVSDEINTYSLPINLETYRSVTYGYDGNSVQCCGNPNEAKYNLASTSESIIRYRKHLSQILYILGTDTLEVIDFIASSNNCSNQITDKKLDTIRVRRGKNGTNSIWDFVFTYDCSIGRLTLKQLLERQASPSGTVQKEPYRFSYNTTTLPDPTDNATDHWGYYNGSFNSQLIPNLLKHINAGGNRNPDEYFTRAGILEEVFYPTGGFSCYEYEKHQVENTTDNAYVSGLRIKTIQHYDRAGVLLLKRSYKYVQANGSSVSSGILHQPVNYINNATFTKYFVGSIGVNPCAEFTCTNFTISATNRSFLGAVQGDVVGYSRVEEIIESNISTATSGKTVCLYKNQSIDNSDYDHFGYDLMTRKEIYDASNNIIERMDYTYSVDTMQTSNAYSNDAVENRLNPQITNTFKATAQANQDNRNYLCRLSNGTFEWRTSPQGIPMGDYQFYETKFERTDRRLIRRRWIYPKREITTRYFYDTNSLQNGSVITKQFFVYGDTTLNAPTRTITINSDNIAYESQTEYLANQPSSSVVESMKLNNRWATPFQQTQRINGQIVYKTRTEYANFGSILPHKIYEFFPNRGEFLSEVITYDNLGNPNLGFRHYEQDIPTGLSDTLSYFQPVSMLWSHYGAALAARVQNADQGEIAYTSFEETTALQGNWNITNAANNIKFGPLTARTGNGYFQSTNNEGLTRFLRPGKYIISFYVRGGEAGFLGSGINILKNRTAVPDVQDWVYREFLIEVTQSTDFGVASLNNVAIDEVRLYPADALMTTFAYDKDTRQLLSTADENGIATRYEYDGLQRLTGVRNFDNHYFQVMEYQYRNQSNAHNFIKQWQTLLDGRTTSNQVKSLGSGSVLRNVQYFDGLGRPTQSIAIGQSPTGRDIVSFMTYDQFGRESTKYLPYTIATNGGAFRDNYLSEQASFISTEFGAGETNFGKMTYDLEESPLNRVFKEYAPGSDWATKPKEVQYQSNLINEVRNFTVAGAFYAANTLYKTVQFDEDGKRTTTFTDKIGRTVMVDQAGSRTYYLYDLRGLLTQVIQPTGGNLGHANTSYIASTPEIKAASFEYRYDNEYRLFTKKIPGTGLYEYAYNDLDQLVLTQDPEAFKTFTKYDVLGRPIMTGRTYTNFQPTSSEKVFESPSNSNGFYYTTNQAFPSNDPDLEVFTLNYYDDHDWNETGGDEATYQTTSDFTNTNYPFVRGLMTGSQTAIPTNQSYTPPSTYLKSAVFYDKFRRVVHTQTDNHLQGRDVTWSSYNFPGWLLKTKREHNAIVDGQAKAVTIRERYTYDPTGRLERTYHQVNNDAEQLLCDKFYNERDELELKRLGDLNDNSDGFLQDVDYTYNIRGWLTQMNDFATTGDLFSMKLSYTQNVAANFNNPVNYNGNITAMEWKTAGDANVKVYSFNYDNLNRLTLGVYGERTGAGSYTGRSRYDNEYSYDADGNITTLERKGLVNGSGQRIDMLDYSYFNGKLVEIEESSNKSIGFKTLATNGMAQYEYDNNGNMTSDGHKGINVAYNYLNLPISVVKAGEGSMDWVYDAVGNKLSKTVRQTNLVVNDNPIANGAYQADVIQSSGTVADGSEVTFIASDSVVLKAGFVGKDQFIAKMGNNAGETRHYVGGIEYYDGEMEAIYHEAGRVVLENNVWNYEYVLTDHLGNTRVVFRNVGGVATVVQENDYYPFGMEFEEGTSGSYNYTYNGKERQTELSLKWLDFGARCLMTDNARWIQVDPLASEMASWSPFNFGYNNPIRFTDPKGMNPDDIVYYDSDGNEVNRIKSDTEFKTYVQTGSFPAFAGLDGDIPIYSEAPMPNIIQNKDGTDTTEPKYQNEDYQIAAETFIFNQEKNSGNLEIKTDGNVDIPSSATSTIPDLDPTVVKAVAMQESAVGTNITNGDIMQVNVVGDWNESKSNYGLTKGTVPDVKTSINAGIRVLASKGFKGGVEYNSTTGQSSFTWKGGKDWSTAVNNYNGGGVKNYGASVMKMVRESKRR